MPLFCAVLSGILYPLALAPFRAWPISFFCIAPLFFALFRVKGRAAAFLTGGLFGLFFACGTGYWLYESIVSQYEKSPATAAWFLALCVGLPHFLVYGLFGLSFRLLRRPGLFFAAAVAPA